MHLLSVTSFVFVVAVISTAAQASEKSVIDVKSACAALAAESANADVTTVDVWLSRFRATYDSCFKKLEPRGEVQIPERVPPVAQASPTPGKRKAVKVTTKSKPPKVSPVRISKARHKLPIVLPVKITAGAAAPFLFPAGTKAELSWKANCAVMLGTSGKDDSMYLSKNGVRTSCNIKPDGLGVD